MAVAPTAWVTLGRIAGVFGVEGWLRVHSFTDPRSAILTQHRWWLGSGVRREWEVVAGRRHGVGIVANLSGVADREAARELIGSEVAVPRSSLPPVDGYYQADLVGLAVRNREGVELGRVSGFIATPAHDVIVVEDGPRERLIPYAPGVYVDEVLLTEGVMLVDWNPKD